MQCVVKYANDTFFFNIYFVFRALWDDSLINTNKMSHHSTFYFLFCHSLHVLDTARSVSIIRRSNRLTVHATSELDNCNE
jgi:hypothetical protein